MANPFDQFDDVPVAEPTTPPTVQGGQPPMAGDAPMPEGTPTPIQNPFNNEELPDNSKMTTDEWDSEFYTRLRRGDTAEDIIAWAESTPFKIVDNMDFRRNIILRDDAAKKGIEVPFGRVNHLDPGVSPHVQVLQDAGTIARRASNMALFNFGDEITSAVGATAGMGEGDSWYDRYRYNHRAAAELEDLENKVSPGAAMTGDALGIAASLLIPVKGIDKAASMVPKVLGKDPGKLTSRMLAGMVGGAGYGGLAATGEGTPDDRFKETPTGMVLGSTLGAAFPVAEKFLRRVARPIMERLSPNNAKALADRTALTEPELRAMEQKLREMEELGLEPTLLDILPERARAVVGTAGRKDSARETMQDFAAGRVDQLPERVARVAQEEIRPAGVKGTDEEMQRAILSQRDADIEAALDPIRLTPLPMNDEILSILGTDVGQQAINNIIREMPDAARRAAYMELAAQAKQAARGVDPRLGEAQQQAALAQLREGTNFDVDMSERIGRELNRMARVGEGSGGLAQMGQTVRSAARQSPVFDEAMKSYAAASRASDAVSVGSGRTTIMDESGRVQRTDDEGRGFLNEDPDRFAQRFNELLDSPEMRNITTDIPVKGKIDVRRDGYGMNKHEVTYTAEDGTNVTASISLTDNGETAYINVIGAPANWIGDRGAFGNAGVIDMMRAFKGQFPSVTRFKGDRVTGARARNADRVAGEMRGEGDYNYDLMDDIQMAAARGESSVSGEITGRYDERDIQSTYRTLLMRLEGLRTGPRTATNDRLLQEYENYASVMRNSYPGLERVTLPTTSRGPVGGTTQIVRAPATQRTTTEPRVRIATGEERVPPAEQARYDRERATFDQETARRAQGFGGLTDEDFNVNPEVVQRISDALDEYYRRGSGSDVLRALSREIDNATAPQLAAMYRNLQQMRDEAAQAGETELLPLLDRDLQTLEAFAGQRISRAEAGRVEPLVEPTPPTAQPVLEAAPDQRSLARLGAAEQVRREASRSPEAANRVARQFVRSPAQRQRSATMLGNRSAERVEQRMKGELDRVNVARAQASPEGPGRDGNMDGAESGVNVLYNPTSPVAWVRESTRYLSRLGMTDETAQFIVNNATDPSKTAQMIALLEKQGMRREQAQAFLDQLRDSFVKYAVSSEGNPYDAQNR